MTKASDNDFPSVLLTEQSSAPANPASGKQRAYIRTSDHALVTVNSSGTVTPVGSAASGSITASGYTQNTAKLLGRTTGSSGAIEEISVGSGLTLSAGSLSASGGGGATHSFVGYNTIGASNEAPTKQTQSYFKAFTPGSSGMLLSVSIYIDQTGTDAYTGFTCGLNADNSGSPGQLLAWNGSTNNDGNQVVFEKNSSGIGDPGWVQLPLSFYCTGSTQYWLQILFLNNSSTIHIYYDTSGSDPTNNNGGANALADGRRYTLTNSTKKYSIRGDYLA